MFPHRVSSASPFPALLISPAGEEVEWNGTEQYDTVQWDGGVEHAGYGGMKWNRVGQSAEQ